MTNLTHLKMAFPLHMLAQRLNNRAAHYIESGKYDAAVSTLVRALRISEDSSENQNTNQEHSSCSCERCSLEYCMSFSQRMAQENKCSQRKANKKSHGSSSTLRQYNDNVSGERGYVHRQPIQIPIETIEDGHHMGIVLPLILTFNLALAHHLSVLDCGETMIHPKLRRVLRLYELAYRWQLEEPNLQVDSVQFTIVISNNLGEIHRMVSNREKHQRCLQHLLSSLMFLVEYQQTPDAMDMDGFLQNTSELILNRPCAGAA